MGVELRCYWECLEEQLGNLGKLLGTSWNMMRTIEKKHKILTLQEEKN
jgi:hypothetical protein